MSSPSANSKGAATSAAKMQRRSGSDGPAPGRWVYIPREGWVSWPALHASVTAAFEAWRRKKSLEGVIINDGWEWRQAQIAEQVGKKSGMGLARRMWLQEWARKHAEIERRARADALLGEPREAA